MARFPGKDGYDVTIGVNRAATGIPCDVWACGDHPLITKIHESVIGTPKLFTTLVSHEHREQHGPRWRGETALFESLLGEFPREWQWELFTATAAACFAAHLGAKSIDLWGSGLCGKADWDGVEAGANRSDDRWRCEAGIWHRLTVVLGERGIAINRSPI